MQYVVHMIFARNLDEYTCDYRDYLVHYLETLNKNKLNLRRDFSLK